MLKCITYVSSSKIESPKALLKLFEKSKTYNESNSISGVLIHNAGNFMQVLEGEEKEVDALYYKVLSDKRHSQVIKLIDFPIPGRLFQEYNTSFSLVSSSSEFK